MPSLVDTKVRNNRRYEVQFVEQSCIDSRFHQSDTFFSSGKHVRFWQRSTICGRNIWPASCDGTFGADSSGMDAGKRERKDFLSTKSGDSVVKNRAYDGGDSETLNADPVSVFFRKQSGEKNERRAADTQN